MKTEPVTGITDQAVKILKTNLGNFNTAKIKEYS